MTVVSDTSPINYLCQIGEIEVLPKLFDEILIPPAVQKELSHPKAPASVAAWLARIPAWAKMQAPSLLQPNLGLGAGETEAISLAMELGLPTILIDEKAGRVVAEHQGLLAVGTLAILISADLRGLLDFTAAIARLSKTNFHFSQSTIDEALRELRARKGR